MINTEWFKLRMEIQKISQRQMANQLGIDHGALSLTLRGKRKMQLEEASKIAQILNVSTTEVLRAAGIDEVEGIRKVNVVGTINVDSTVSIDHDNPAGSIPAPPDMPPGSFALQFLPGYIGGFLHDAIAFVAPVNGINIESINRLSVLKVRGGDIICSYLRRGLRHGSFSVNNEQVDLDWASPVLWIKT